MMFRADAGGHVFTLPHFGHGYLEFLQSLWLTQRVHVPQSLGLFAMWFLQANIARGSYKGSCKFFGCVWRGLPNASPELHFETSALHSSNILRASLGVFLP